MKKQKHLKKAVPELEIRNCFFQNINVKFFKKSIRVSIKKLHLYFKTLIVYSQVQGLDFF